MSAAGGVGVRPDDTVDLLACQTRVLALISSGAPLPTVLDAITGQLEQLMPDSFCSLLLSDDTGALRHASAPSLPADYLAAIDGLVPGPSEGSCGTAAYLAEAVVVTDIDADERWDDYRALAQAAGLRACWSTPILGSAATVVGTFAVYHPGVHHPTLREQGIVEQLSYLASVAIEHAAMIGALTVSEERFRRAFEDSAVAMGLLDEADIVTRANDALLRLTGPIPAGTTLAELIASEDGETFADRLALVRSGRVRSAQCETRVAGGPDGERIVTMTMSLVRGARNEPVQVSVNVLDITERLAAQRERRARAEAEVARRTAESASQAKSEFLSAVSHEMRTPLQAITGFAELLATLELDGDHRAEALRHITDGASHLLALVDDTLDLSRIEANALVLSMQPLAAATVASDVIEFLAPVADRHEVALVYGAQDGVVEADARRLRQVLINLVSNAIRYSGSGAVVTVCSAAVGDEVQLIVQDNGPGIPERLRARLFEPFVHAESVDRGPQRDSRNGVGLGLMLARGLTEAMNGRLTLADADGGGTVATVVLRASSD